MSVKDYVKCAWENKSSLVGLGLASAAGITGYNLVESQDKIVNKIIIGTPPTMLLVITIIGAFGNAFSTYEAYKRTKEHLKDFGRVDERFKEEYERAYCSRAGMNLAIKESKLEGVLA
ncbi:MAG: hypothetical protein AABW73_02310 [Nanoarchaeota archaeon]